MSLATVIDRSRNEPESWRYTDMEKLLARKVVRTHLVGAGKKPTAPQSPRLVFVDGDLSPEQSHFGNLPRDIITGDARQGYRLALAGQTCLVTQPIELLFIAAPGAPAEMTTKLHIELGASGRLSLLERHESSSAHIVETTIELGPQAKLVHGKLVKGDAHIALTKAVLAEGAFYDNFTLIKGGKLTRNEIEARLEGPLAQCALNGLMLLADSDHADTSLRVVHAAKHGTSRQLYKTVANGKARGVFQGKIVVEKAADQTDGAQLSKALLLSDQAEVDARPELEINADDVKCSHGCTAGNIEADALFYLRSRGLNEAEARALLIRAFASETLNEIPVTEWREMFAAELEAWCDEQD